MKKILIIIGFFLLSPVSYSAGLNIFLSKNKITTDESIQMVITTEGNVDQRKVSILGLESFTIAAQSSSQNMQIVNGEIQAQLEIILVLQPKNKGVFVLGPASITNAEGNTILSQKKTITVMQSLVDKTKEKLLESLEEKVEEIPVKQEEANLDGSKKSFPKIQRSTPMSFYFWGEFLSAMIFIFVLWRWGKILKKK